MYKELPLSNQLSTAFNGFFEYSRYIAMGTEPLWYRRSGFVRPDLIYVSTDKTYLIEIKTGINKVNTRSKRDRCEQLLKAGHFMHHNFDTEFELVGVGYNERTGRMVFHYFGFDPDEKKLVKKKTNHLKLDN